MAVQIQLRRDTAANWTSANPLLAEGELGIETDTGKAKIGDGATVWAVLPYWNTSLILTTTLTAGENLSGGNMLWFSGTQVFKADASAGRPAFGFTRAAVTSGNPAEVVFGGLSTGLSGLTAGLTYFLSATVPGGFTSTAPSGGNIVQRIGVATSTTELAVEIGQPLTTI